MAFYYCGDAVYLENGRAFAVGGIIPDRGAFLDRAAALFRDTEVRVFENPGERIYTVSVESPSAEALLANFLPLTDTLPGVAGLRLELVERQGELHELRVSSEISSGEGTPVTVEASLRVNDGAPAPELPQAVRRQLASAGGAAEAGLPEADLLRLLTGWIRLNAADPLRADVTLYAECGPLLVNTDLEWERGYDGDTRIDRIRKNGREWIFTAEGVASDAAGNPLPKGAEDEAAQIRALFSLAYRLCLTGQPDCAARDGRAVYRLALDENDRNALADLILPEARIRGAVLTDGFLEVTVEDDAIAGLRLSCGGTVELLTVDVPVSISAEFKNPRP